MSDAETQAKGVIAILTDPDGRVVGHAADFSADGYGGFSLQQAQSYRARRRLALNVVRDGCAHYIAKAMDGYDCDGVVQRLVGSHGFKQTEVNIGHEEEE